MINSTKNVIKSINSSPASKFKSKIVDDYSQNDYYDNILAQSLSKTNRKPKIKHKRILSKSPHSTGSIQASK